MRLSKFKGGDTVKLIAIILLSSLALSCTTEKLVTQSCTLPDKPETQFDFDVEKDPFGINKNSSTDYFKLALSWSPDYCEKIQKDIAKLTSNGKAEDAKKLSERNQQQCFSGNDFKWVVHGLWSSSCDGNPLGQCTDLADIKKHPRFCQGDLAQLPYEQVKPYLCMSPNADLLQGEWEKHGACDFPSAVNYFQKTKQLFSELKIPNAKPNTIELAKWMDVNNPKLAHKKLGFSATEMYICYDKKFLIIDCPQKN
jgi:ribonuclease T2